MSIKRLQLSAETGNKNLRNAEGQHGIRAIKTSSPPFKKIGLDQLHSISFQSWRPSVFSTVNF